MKVKCFVMKPMEVEVEIDDKFRKLAVPRPWENPEIEDSDYEECIKAVEEATNFIFGEGEFYEQDARSEGFILAVHSAENDEVMMED